MKLKSLVLFFILFSFAHAQEAGIAPVKIWTDNIEIENPFGYSIYYYQPIWKTGIKVEYTYAQNERDYFGYLISGFFVNPEEPVKEQVESKSSLSVFDISVVIPNVITSVVNLNLGIGISFNTLKGNRYGITTGKSVELYDENKIGFFYAITMSRERLFDTPIKAELLFKFKFLSGGTYATDIEQPFTGAMEIKTLQLNVAYVL